MNTLSQKREAAINTQRQSARYATNRSFSYRTSRLSAGSSFFGRYHLYRYFSLHHRIYIQFVLFLNQFSIPISFLFLFLSNSDDSNSFETELAIREVWLEQASLLIEYEQYGNAKELLNEALFHAKTFDDKTVQAKCYHLLAKIAYFEDEVDSAIRVRHHYHHIHIFPQ